ncbi:MAG: hypothetical protein ABEK84_04255 [Salinibacter sp.]
MDFVQEAATEFDPDACLVRTESGEEHPFDVLAVDVSAVNPAVPERHRGDPHGDRTGPVRYASA